MDNMNLFRSKNIERKIGPKFAEANANNYDLNKFKPRLYEEKIDFDRMRMFRLQRVREQMEICNIGATILFDPINIRYATDARNMSLFTMHTLARFVFIPASGPVILCDYPKSKHLSQDLCTIDEVREVVSWDFFSSGDKVEKNAKIWSQQVDELMQSYSKDNKHLAIDICDPVGIQALQNNYSYIFVIGLFPDRILP